VLVDNKLVAEIGKRHLLHFAVKPDGRETKWGHKRGAVVVQGGLSPRQGGQLNTAKGCYGRKPHLSQIE